MRAGTELGVGASKSAAPLDPAYAALAIENATDRDHAPDHPIASRELEALYARTNQWEALAALLLDSAGRAEVRIALLERVARMYEDHGDDARAAFLVWAAVLRSAPSRRRRRSHRTIGAARRRRREDPHPRTSPTVRAPALDAHTASDCCGTQRSFEI